MNLPRRGAASRRWYFASILPALLAFACTLSACQQTGSPPDNDAPGEPPIAATVAKPEISPTATSAPASPPEETNPADADVTHVRAVQAADGTWTFHVTVAHPDTGWEDYVDGWDVVLPDGIVVKPDPSSPYTRLLLHPHENEQPFTRSQSGIELPLEVTAVTVRAHDLIHGFGGNEVIVELKATAGPAFEIERE